MNLKNILILIFALPLYWGCGVKGDPVPPTKPPDLGRGQPTFKDAVKEIQPAPINTNSKKEEEDER